MPTRASRHRCRQRQSHRRPLTAETLESRRVLATFTVTSLSDAGSGTLRDAVEMANAAPSADDIVFDASLNGGTINLTSDHIEITDDIVIDARDLSAGLTIDLSPADSTPTVDDGNGIRAFFADGDTNMTSIGIHGFAIMGGDVGGQGGGICLAAGDVSISDVQLIDNYAGGFGGGLFLQINGSANGQLNDLILSSNTSGLAGGGIHIQTAESTVEISDSSISGNSSTNGGGVSVTSSGGGLVTIEDGTINLNMAEESGGGIRAQSSLIVQRTRIDTNLAGDGGGGIGFDATLASLTIEEARIFDNTAASGGGISLTGTDADLTVKATEIFSNGADIGGGGIQIDVTGGSDIAEVNIERSAIFSNSVSGSGSGGGINFVGRGAGLSLDNSTVSGNQANGSGGGLFVFLGESTFGSALRVANSTVASNRADADNTAAGFGGGISLINLDGASVALATNSIFADNVRPTKTGDVGDDIAGEIIASYSLFESNINGASIIGSDNLLDVDPNLEPLADNGGSTRTHELLPGSPAIDAGDPAFAGTDFDQRGSGFDRVQDGNGDSIARIDIGALEVTFDPTANVAPIANAGADQTVEIETTVMLDGSGSSDPDGGPQPLTYSWEILSGPTEATLTGADQPMASFVASAAGTYEIQLTVFDGFANSSDTVLVTATDPTSGWHNTDNEFDVDGSGVVAPLDALLVINELNEHEFTDMDGNLIADPPDPPVFLDVTDDGIVAPIDALLVINELNSTPPAAARSSTEGFVFDVPVPAFEFDGVDEETLDEIVRGIFEA